MLNFYFLFLILTPSVIESYNITASGGGVVKLGSDLELSLKIGDGESTIMNVFKDLPQAKCDMIVVSPVPLKGENAFCKECESI